MTSVTTMQPSGTSGGQPMILLLLKLRTFIALMCVTSAKMPAWTTHGLRDTVPT